MNTRTDHSVAGTRRRTILLAVLTCLALAGLSTTMYLWNDSQELSVRLDTRRLESERLLAEKLQLEKQIEVLNGRVDAEHEALNGSEKRVSDLRRRAEAAVERARASEISATKVKALAKEVSGLRSLKEELEQALAGAKSESFDLKTRLEQMTAERDALAAAQAEWKAGAHMVNNAEVDALRGKKGRLTVLARRTKEIRMAFDLPQALAGGTTFTIITPDGQRVTGGDPRISMFVDPAPAEGLASISMRPVGSMNEPAARVHLRYTPNAKLKPGTYRIDVLSNGDYLNSVLLNLR